MAKVIWLQTKIRLMNILYYLANFPKLSKSFILNEIYCLEEMGHNVAVFALNDPNENIRHQEYDEISAPIYYADTPGYSDVTDLISFKIVHPKILKHTLFKASPLRHATELHRGKQCIEFVNQLDFEIDLIHTHFASINRIPAIYVASFYDIPCTITTHAYDLYKNTNKSFLKYLLDRMDHIITISDYNKEYIEKDIGTNNPVSVVHAGIRPEKFTPTLATDYNRILTVSRLINKKGITYAIKAVAQIDDRFPQLEYHIVGSGPLKDQIRRQINEYNLENTVKLRGNISDDELIREFDKSACFILPCVITNSGDRDGIPVVLMESMAMETPPISTEISGIPELIDHQQNGLLIKPKETDKLATAVSSLITNKEKQSQFAQAARQKVHEEFNAAKETSKLESIFSYVINNH